MHSFWFAVSVLLIACELGQAVPVSVDQLTVNNDSETRLIVPPEMTSNYFELLKVKSERDTNFTKAENADSTPMNFLRSSDKNATNLSSLDDKKPLLAFDGSKQSPIFITIPIYISSGSDGLPLIAASIERITPSEMASKKSHSQLAKTEDKIKQEDGNKQDQDKI